MLGPVEVWSQGRRHHLGTAKEKTVLAAMLIEAGRTVSAQTLAERLWDDEDIPQTARETLQTYVSRLRRHLRLAGDDSGLIVSTPAGGYRLQVPSTQIDVHCFERLLSRAHAAAAGDPEQALGLLREAETHWGGEPLAGISGQWAEGVRRALTERRRGAVLTRIELELRTGRESDDIISELTGLTSRGRIDQSAIALLMTALARAGRLYEALDLYRHTRVRLREELGVDPRAELQVLHQSILRGETTKTGASQLSITGAAPAPDTLDRDPSYLVGRDAELDDLLAGVGADLGSGSGLALCALDGMPGVGKSALAIRAAHRLRARCPDGVLQLNLRTHHPHQPPLGSSEALTQLLEALATPSGEIGRAASLDALAALWRRSSSGRRLLLVLDDVKDAEQVTPLIPASPGSIVLITSRRRLLDLDGARQHTVQVLDEDAACALLAHVAGQDPETQLPALARVARRCGALPLALSVVAAYLRAHPAWGPMDVVQRLDAASGLPNGDPLTAPVHRAFSMSYSELAAQPRALLRRIAAHPGQEIDLHATAALADADLATTEVLLDTLLEHRLLEEPVLHRYRLHDLLREYALGESRRESEQDDTRGAMDRLLDYYLSVAAKAEHILHPHYRPIDLPALTLPRMTPDLDTPSAAQDWMTGEHLNLAAVAEYAHEHGRQPHARLLPHLLAQHLDRHGYWPEAVEILYRAAQTDVRLDDPAQDITAQLQTDLAAAYVRTRDLDRALEYASAALAIWKARHDRRGQADALLELGRIHWYARRPTDAVRAYTRSALLYERTANQYGHTVADYHLGIVLFELGRHDDAIERTRRALETAQNLADPSLECDLLANLGEMYRQTDRHEQALAYFQRAQAIADGLDDPQNTAVLANNIGAVHQRVGEHDKALVSFDTALRLFRALGDARNEIDTLVNLARTHAWLADHGNARLLLQRALTLVEHVSDPLRHAHVHLEIGHLHRSQGLYTHALASYQDALARAREAAAPLEQAHAHRALGETLLATDDPAAARPHRRRAAEIYRRLDHPDAALIPTIP
jgi:DNA-binding SARP family transcriptional activator/tetratricopeptide (TPR) repeat protein